MNELFSLGLILLLALLAGHLVQALRLPEVTGYILTGIALGPSLLGWLNARNLAPLQVLSEVALGLILFSIGSVFEFERFRTAGRSIVFLTLMESSLAGALVFGGTLLLGQPWRVAALLGAISMTTAPASTLMVIRESGASGLLSRVLLSVIVVNNIFCLVAFSLIAAVIELISSLGQGALLGTIYNSIFFLLWQLLGSVALGVLIGLLLAAWASKVKDTGEMLMLLAGSILLCVGVARLLEVSQLVASLVVGATMVNLSSGSKRLFRRLAETDPPFYAIFFVIAGADLDIAHVAEIGWVGAAYVMGRVLGKAIGARVGAGYLGLPDEVRRNLGFALFAQADLAVALMLLVSRRFPDIAPAVSVVVLSGVVIYEMLGPIGVRFAITRAGEGQAHAPEAESIWA